jgi:hypothetical protein
LKKLILAALFFCTLTGFGQIKLEVLAGYNDVNLSNRGRLPFGRYSVRGDDYSPINSFHAGAGTEIALGKRWSLEPALVYFGSGAHLNSNSLTPGITFFSDVSINVYYLRLPVNLLYQIATAGSFHVFAGAGLYVSRGIWGKEKGISYTEGAFQSANQVVDSHVRFDGQGSLGTGIAVNPYDFGYTLLAGIEWKQFKLAPSISNGLIKVYPGSGSNVYNCAFSVALTYKIATIL